MDEDHNDEINSLAYRDILFNTIIGLLMLIAVAFLLISVKKQLEANKTSTPPGNMIVHIVWPPGDTDVDLWVDGPGEIVPVGYSNKGGLLWNLLRDDLGTQPDATGINYEDAFTRGIIPGEYTINVHCYRCYQVPLEVKTQVEINTGDPGKSAIVSLGNWTTKMVTNGQERTVVRFKLNEDGTIAPGSMQSTYKPLRSAQKPNMGHP